MDTYSLTKKSGSLIGLCFCLSFLPYLGFKKHCFFENFAFADDLSRFSKSSEWPLILGSYRKGTHVQLSGGKGDSIWHVLNLGDINNKSTDDFKTEFVISKLQYSFHFQLLEDLGSFLGISAGIAQYSPEVVVIPSSNQTVEYSPSTSFHLPSVLVGVNFSNAPIYRLGLSLDSYLEQFNFFKVKVIDHPDEEYVLSMHIAISELIASLELFYLIDCAVALQVHQTVASYFHQPQLSDGLVIGSIVNKIDRWISLGITWQAL